MALPSGNIGPINFAPQIQSNALSEASTRYAIQNMASLGQNIANSLSIQNARKEAEAMGPIYGQQYQQGFQAIQNGDVAGGLGQIYATSSQAGQNPILARMTQETNQAAGYLANNYFKGQLQQQAFGQRAMLQEDAQAFRQGLENQEQAGMDRRAGMGMEGGVKPPTASQKLTAINTFASTADNTLKGLEAAQTPEEIAGLLQNFYGVQEVLNKAGFEMNNPHVTAKMKEQLNQWNEKISQAQSDIDGGGDALSALKSWWSGGDKKAELAKYKALVKEVTDASQRAIKEGIPTDNPDRGMNVDVALPEEGGVDITANLTDAAPPETSSSGITQAQYDALPSGSIFTAPDGTRRRKP